MKVYFENQRFNQWWLYLIFIIPLFALVIPVLLKTEKTMANINLPYYFITLLILFLVYLFIFSIKLKTRIDEQGIHYQFFPFNSKLKLIPWSELEQCFCRKYKPLSEFGRWGYNRINSRNGRALNIRGNWGIQLVFKNGKKLLLGTQKPNDINNILETYTNKLSPTKFLSSI